MSDTERIHVKSSEEIKIIKDKVNDTGFIIESAYTEPIKNVYIPSNLDQRLNNNEIPILQLDIPTHIIGLVIEHSLDSLLDSLLICDKFCISSSSTECLIIQYFKNKLLQINIYSYYNDKILIQKNVLLKTRLFGAGENWSKIAEEQTRNDLIELHDSNVEEFEIYPDTEKVSTYYKFPLIFYCDLLENIKENDEYEIKELIKYLDDLNKIELKKEIIEINSLSFENCDIIRFPEYRKYVNENILNQSFHLLLIKEQMFSTIYKNKNVKVETWTLDNIQNLNKNDSEWILKQIVFPEKKQPFNIVTICMLNMIRANILNIPTNTQAIKRLHQFSNNILKFENDDLKQRFYNNLLITGSTFCYSCCAYVKDKDNLVDYENSDIDCPILIGDNNKITQEEFEHLVNEKINVLMLNQHQSNNELEIEKKIDGTKIKVLIKLKNNSNVKKLEFYPIAFSKETCWKHFARYHFGFVRGFFDGSLFHILPSAVIGVISRLSIDIRYCSTVRTPQELIFKYWKRGFMICLNTNEMNSLELFSEEYKKSINKFKKYFKKKGFWCVKKDSSYFIPNFLSR